ncbi:3-oxoacyl-[acyl-carrier-protein] synthase 3 [Actinoplanes sp. NBRC 14428]|uniref:3-oxoacyl-[acyl-carrier-protein] synthase-3 n=1 Tax=Pseudosporangium ferrugineum TaxID=439699 RepID=A0A2T0SAR4_9ACTN|nr:3-oxoacyl-[acyl-carrier-protein] synthase III C-terminal domain-containing protein [Pseudosporangium ferrugineum]PRY30510.1 3-oxoacyl-[acyl-carrier-protein] synthase-3 [Pseudosporangium ferrugineum]BCJ50046.1 3-oxoacyl-[acyl-carrier-protein] synthase 3 [Actinoplanes sp. NBRC 14428]
MTALAVDGISYRHGGWRDVDDLPAARPDQIKALNAGGLRRYSVLDRPPREWYAECATESLEKAGVAPADVDAVVFISSTFAAYDDHADLITLAHTLGMSHALPLGVFLGQCTNFSQALMVIDGLFRAGHARTVLLVGADALDEGRASRILDGNLSVFSDTVFTCVVTAGGASGFRLRHVRHRVVPELSALDPARQFLRIIDLFAGNLGALCRATYEETGHGPDDLARLVLANLAVPVLKNYAAVAAVPFDRVPAANIPRFGHCFAYDQLITLSTLAERDEVRPGDLLHVVGVGGNYVFSSLLVSRL